MDCYSTSNLNPHLIQFQHTIQLGTLPHEQLNDYANQNNPNNKAYKARIANDKKTKRVSKKYKAVREVKCQAKLYAEIGLNADLDWMCYSNPYDFD